MWERSPVSDVIIGDSTKSCQSRDAFTVSTWYTVGTESIQNPLHFSLFVILQPFAKII